MGYYIFWLYQHARYTKDIPTVVIHGNGVIFLNIAWFNSLSNKDQNAVARHEWCHYNNMTRVF